MTASLFREKRWRNKIRLIAIKSAGVTPQGAAPVLFSDSGSERMLTYRQVNTESACARLKLQSCRVMQEHPWEIEFCFQ